MKKVMVLILTIVLCIASLSACNSNVPHGSSNENSLNEGIGQEKVQTQQVITIREDGTIDGERTFLLSNLKAGQAGEFDLRIERTSSEPYKYNIGVKLEGELFEGRTPMNVGLQKADNPLDNEGGFKFHTAVNFKRENFTYIAFTTLNTEVFKLPWRWLKNDDDSQYEGKNGKIVIKVQPHPEDLVGANIFGINTMIFDGDNVRQHLDWAHHLVGDGGYIRQMFGPIKKSTRGPSSKWVEILKECYNRNLIPIIRITSEYAGGYWNKPEATGPRDYSEFAAAVRRVFEQLPMKKGVPVYVEVLNEMNLKMEWGNEKPDPIEYGHLLVDVSKALRSIGDPRIRIVTGGLAQTDHLKYLEEMIKNVPESLYAFDYLGSHPYPGTRPPDFNIHDGTADGVVAGTIDSYLPELEILERYGRKGTKVILTETGYSYGNTTYGMGYVTEELRKDFSVRAFTDFWSKWPEIIAACPYELSAVQAKNWKEFDWVHYDSGSDENGYPTKPYPHYKAVASLPKPPYKLDPALMDTVDKNIFNVESGNLGIQAVVTVSSSIEDYGWEQKKINNGSTVDADLGWTSNGIEGAEEWVIYEFTQEKQIEKVILYPRSDEPNTGKYFPQEFSIQVSNDKLEWNTVYSFKHAGEVPYNPGSEPQTYNFDKVKCKYLRLLITRKTNNGSGGYHAQLSEMEVY